ncbi:MAG: zinc-dependent dehydrogenase [Thaumarchaeota archaeon]|jgi:L-iditol 2-dehydrogenase|nr:zinc-dependent dehydrogenase [Candidatus Geocrenenecus arthurdayi]MCL7403688.1 zinc-dependent dehydrogenase [Candidatus Geocrenenecus arthurdayi]
MKAAVFYKPGDLRVEEVEKPTPRSGEILIKNVVALTCGTDLKMFLRGHPYVKPPIIMGHEFSGVIEEVGGDVSTFQVGDRVVSVNSAPCGTCVYCKLGRFNLCERLDEFIIGFSVDGAYAEYVRVPSRIVKYNVYRLPDNLEHEVAALLEPFSCVVRGHRAIHIDVGDTVTILGAGPIGLMHMMLARNSNAGKIIVIDVSWDRLRFAEKLGADVVINPNEEDVSSRVKGETGGLGADIVIEAVGNPDVWETAIKLSRKGGKVLFFGGPPRGTAVSIDTYRIHYEEVMVQGSFHFTPEDVLRAFKIICSGRLPLKDLITGKAKIEDILSVFEKLKEGKEIKVALTF